MKNNFFIPDYIEINGGQKLVPNATINISGAKNEVLGVMAAALLTDQPVILRNVPHISDVLDMGRIMIGLGCDIQFYPASRVMKLHAAKITSNVLSDEASKFRASYYLWGPLLARFAITHEFDRISIKVPGGCSFGGRPFGFHTDLIENVFGAEIKELGDSMELILPAREPDDNSPMFSTRKVSHGATFHWLLSVATQRTDKMICPASLEPEVPHFVQILNRMGANIRGTFSTGKMSCGRGELLRGADVAIMPDRLEAGSYAMLAFATRSAIMLSGADEESCRPWLNSVIEIIGRKNVDERADGIYLDFTNVDTFRGQKFMMSPIPGKETDMQQVWSPVLAGANSESHIFDPLWPGRKAHLAELEKFGLNYSTQTFQTQNQRLEEILKITIRPSELHAANANGMDLRGTFALIIAAAAASGISKIEDPAYALRGYPDLISNLQRIGVNLRQSENGQNLPPLPEITSDKQQ
jgi:UDP-N-acetylglucosamine 1-carboxyvinyltransferase